MFGLLLPSPPSCALRITSSSSSPSSSSFCKRVCLKQSSFLGCKLQSTMPTMQVVSGRTRVAMGVRMMAKRQEELKEIRTKTTEEIKEEVIDLKGELLMLRLQRSARNEFKSSEFGRMRKRNLDVTFLAYLLVITIVLIGLAILEVKWSGIGLEEWWRNEQFWLISGTSAHFYAVIQGLLKVIAGIEISFTLTSKSAVDENEDIYADLYLVKWSSLMIPPITIMMVNIIAIVVGFSRTVYSEVPEWSKLLGGAFFSFWVLAQIARMLTVKREREIEEGINKRLSRKLDRKWKKSIVVRPPPSLRKMQAEEKKAAEAKSSS